MNSNWRSAFIHSSAFAFLFALLASLRLASDLQAQQPIKFEHHLITTDLPLNPGGVGDYGQTAMPTSMATADRISSSLARVEAGNRSFTGFATPRPTVGRSTSPDTTRAPTWAWPRWTSPATAESTW